VRGHADRDAGPAISLRGAVSRPATGGGRRRCRSTICSESPRAGSPPWSAAPRCHAKAGRSPDPMSCAAAIGPSTGGNLAAAYSRWAAFPPRDRLGLGAFYDISDASLRDRCSRAPGTCSGC